ncbi:microsomal glutathione S-transferase 1-like isoform X2 [Culicoides brevitarsis]|uniref:microsomal glutathione S-transferase 1-like isoform X2 n=1 Tax=Culicoides brevitarsis TaxID=469753 RepID=UPI00307BEB85
MEVFDLLNFKNPVFTTYLFWTGVLVLKLFFMVILTARQRYTKGVFANPEDAATKKGKVKFDDEDVERVRRAHLNDLENLVPFFIIGLLYVLTNPSHFLAMMLYRMIGFCRIAHTFVYAVYVIPQPARALAFFGALAPTIYMAVQVVMAFY